MRLCVKQSKICFGIHFVPMSELFSLDSTFCTMHVLSATFSLNNSWAKSKWLRFLVMCLASDAYTQAWLSSAIMVGSCFRPIEFYIPRLDFTSALSVWLTALISDSAVDVDTLPWSVEHQHITDVPRCPMYEVWECQLSRFPRRSASHWNRSWRTWVIVSISVGPSWAWNFRRYYTCSILVSAWEILCVLDLGYSHIGISIPRSKPCLLAPFCHR